MLKLEYGPTKAGAGRKGFVSMPENYSERVGMTAMSAPPRRILWLQSFYDEY